MNLNHLQGENETDTGNLGEKVLKLVIGILSY